MRPSSTHATGVYIFVDGVERMVRFDLFSSQTDLEAWITSLSPAAPTPGVRAASWHDDEAGPGQPAVWIVLCRGHLQPSIVAHECVHAMQMLGVTGVEPQANCVEDLLREALLWLDEVGAVAQEAG